MWWLSRGILWLVRSTERRPLLHLLIQKGQTRVCRSCKIGRANKKKKKNHLHNLFRNMQLHTLLISMIQCKFSDSQNELKTETRAQKAVKHAELTRSKEITHHKKKKWKHNYKKGTHCRNPKLLACKWQLRRAGLVWTAWRGAVYVAWRPDPFQLCPGTKTISPVRLDSLDICRGRWKTGTLQHRVGGGGGGPAGGGAVMSQEQGAFYYFRSTRTWHFQSVMSKTELRWVKEVPFLWGPEAAKFIHQHMCLEDIWAFLTISRHLLGVYISFNSQNLHGDDASLKPGVSLCNYHWDKKNKQVWGHVAHGRKNKTKNKSQKTWRVALQEKTITFLAWQIYLILSCYHHHHPSSLTKSQSLGFSLKLKKCRRFLKKWCNEKPAGYGNIFSLACFDH